MRRLLESLVLAVVLFAAYLVGYTVGDASARAEYVIATCPNHDSVTAPVNEWRLGSPRRTLSVECE